jgi:hypothetical protein
MLELVANLIKEGADVNGKNKVSLHRVFSASVCIEGHVNARLLMSLWLRR